MYVIKYKGDFSFLPPPLASKGGERINFFEKSLKSILL